MIAFVGYSVCLRLLWWFAVRLGWLENVGFVVRLCDGAVGDLLVLRG